MRFWVIMIQLLKEIRQCLIETITAIDIQRACTKRIVDAIDEYLERHDKAPQSDDKAASQCLEGSTACLPSESQETALEGICGTTLAVQWDVCKGTTVAITPGTNSLSVYHSNMQSTPTEELLERLAEDHGV